MERRIPINKEWSNRLYNLRCERKLLQYEVAINCKIDKVLYNRLETGKVNTVSEKVLKQLEEFFETNLSPLNDSENILNEIIELRAENIMLRKLLAYELNKKSNEADSLAKDILANMTDSKKASWYEMTTKLLFGGV